MQLATIREITLVVTKPEQQESDMETVDGCRIQPASEASLPPAQHTASTKQPARVFQKWVANGPRVTTFASRKPNAAICDFRKITRPLSMQRRPQLHTATGTEQRVPAVSLFRVPYMEIATKRPATTFRRSTANGLTDPAFRKRTAKLWTRSHAKLPYRTTFRKFRDARPRLIPSLEPASDHRTAEENLNASQIHSKKPVKA